MCVCPWRIWCGVSCVVCVCVCVCVSECVRCVCVCVCEVCVVRVVLLCGVFVEHGAFCMLCVKL